MAKIYRVKFYNIVTEYIDENGNVKKPVRTYADTKDCVVRRYVENCRGSRIYLSNDQRVDGDVMLFEAHDISSLLSLDYPIHSIKYIGEMANMLFKKEKADET